MTDLQKILETLQRPFWLEEKQGYQDQAVKNGLEAYAEQWIRMALGLRSTPRTALTHLRSLFDGYATFSPGERRQCLKKASEQIGQILEGSVPSVSSDSTDLPLFQSLAGNSLPTGESKPRNRTDGLTQTDGKGLDTLRSPPQVLPVPEAEEVGGEQSGGVGEQKNEQRPEWEDPTHRADVETDVSRLRFLDIPLREVPNIGERRAAMMEKHLELFTVGDLLEHYPRDYLDRSRIRPIFQAGREDIVETIQGRVVNHTEFTPRRKGAPKVCKVMIYDETGIAALVGFGRRTNYMKHSLPVDATVVVSGKFKRRKDQVESTSFEYEVLSEDEAEQIHTGRIVPKYPLTAKLTQRSLRTWAKTVLDAYADQIPEYLPRSIRERQQLLDRSTAVRYIHFPESKSLLDAAHMRIAFDEFFLLELGLALRKQRWEIEEPGIVFDTETPLFNHLRNSLPFELTNAQKRVVGEMLKDMAQDNPMNRLIQGDVGSGKTVVATLGLSVAIGSGYQGALMAPTEILAEQHYRTLTQLLEPLGIRVALFKGDMNRKEREEAHGALASGEIHVAVGTHALIQEAVNFHKLGLVITDEQHRFGVLQRASLKEKGDTPDVLVMTATPIPRTLALTVYGDLNISVIDELPPGRQKVRTEWIRDKDRSTMYQHVEREIRKGQQAYVVYPLVEESEKLEDVKAATEMAEHLQTKVFPGLRVVLLHGRMKADEKNAIMDRFKNREIDILVSTTVIEVGIDVPNATIMIIENAERFGLAQLHQLRGRVGRGQHRSVCYLVADPKSNDGFKRLSVMVRTTDGFVIAEEDLAIRGPGEFFGTRQAGLPDLKLANILRDASLLEKAREEAILTARADPGLQEPQHQLLKKLLRTRWRENLEMASIG